MNEILIKLNELNSEDIKVKFIELITEYMSPAYGSMSKRDFDILLFIKLQKLGVFHKNPEIYDLVTELRITRTKARNLLYESKLRQTSKEELDAELKEHLLNPILLKGPDKQIKIEIGNPFLIDHLKSKLKELKHITDGSFSSEIVQLSIDAYLAVFISYLPDDSTTKLKKLFVELGIMPETTLSGFLKGALKKIGSKIADESGEQVAVSVFDYLKLIMNGDISSVEEKFIDLFNQSA
ncbi:MAG: hypothetical protein RJA76_519 [Bacteroidota bacterium]|jgi:hypothetical protein